MDLFRPFDRIIPARFLARPNRFLIECEIEGKRIKAFLPNPGRLLELLFPGTRLYVIKQDAPARRTSYTVVGVDREGSPVMLDTHKTNDVAQYLLERRLVPGLEEATIVRREVPVGHSRFDFLLADPAGHIYLEVKSCTLFGKRTAMFPDAVTARGARHLEELAVLSMNGARGAVLFVVHWPRAEVFMPDYHTDLYFARALLSVRDRVHIIPVAVRWQHDLSLSREATQLSIPWSYIEAEAQDRGSYLLILRLPESRTLPVGRTGEAFLRKGFYLYIGSAMVNLSRRINRHLRLRKRHHWHIDALRAVANVHAVLAIRSSVRLECSVAEAVSRVADWSIPGFGCSDCPCDSHLFGMADDPLGSPEVHRLLQHFRMDRHEGT